MNNALILNGGSYSSDTACHQLTEALGQQLQKGGWTHSTLQPAHLNLRPCLGCFNCWTKTPGRCVQRDDGEKLLTLMAQADAVFYVTPNRWGNPSPELKLVIERSIPLVLPFFEKFRGETHHPRRYPKQPKLALVGLQDHENPEHGRLFRAWAGRLLLNFRSSHSCIETWETEPTASAEQRAVQILSRLEIQK